MRSEQQRRNYVMDEMVKMCRDGTLFLTELITLPEPIPCYVGDAILGYGLDPQDRTPTRGEYIPPEIEDYRVRIEAIDHLEQEDVEEVIGHRTSRYVVRRGPIVFKRGSRRTDGYEAAYSRDDAKRAGARLYASDSGRNEPIIVHTGKDVVDMSLRDALFCLKQQGKNVRPALRLELQRKLWRVREVHPSEYRGTSEQGESEAQTEATETRRRGRPRAA